MEIKELNLFRELTEDEIKRSLICSSSQVEEFTGDEYIFRQEDKPQRLYFILSGTVMLGKVDAKGRQNYVEYLGEGQGFGETDLFLGHENYEYSALARTKTKVLSVSKHFFYSTCAKNCAHHSRIIFNMMWIFAKEAEKNSRKIHLLTCGTLKMRTASYLLELSKGKKEVKLPMNREDLAAYLNTARPSLSRELSRMQELGMIRLDGRSHVEILDYDALQYEAEGM